MDLSKSFLNKIKKHIKSTHGALTVHAKFLHLSVATTSLYLSGKFKSQRLKEYFLDYAAKEGINEPK